ncbi:putative oxidoreductase [Lojkania enalia]|uniref:Oxidoreductase n=1 Tax=Lojkania enalia TaxID=147567 RepID=A0A9P4K361_9PLEO|nr:putative oxidoreductase [Didymosphaeria enalia]
MGSSGGVFTSLPTLDLSLLDTPQGKARFLVELREALVVVGFFYLTNIERFVPPGVKNAFIERSKELLCLPLEKKLELDMINSKHFLGYSQTGKERTAQKLDNREMFDFLSPVPAPKPDDPIYMNVQGPNQWPDENDVPGFRHAFDTYLAAVGKLGEIMNMLVAEALGLDPMGLMKFFGSPPRNKVSLLKYPEPRLLKGLESPGSARYSIPAGEVESDEEFQGVGAHKDGGCLTYLLQATEHEGLEVQNKCGKWIPMQPLPNSLVVNVGRSLEAITGGVCTATTHRVNLSAKKFLRADGCTLGPRYSFPVFQTLKMDLTSKELASLRIPEAIKSLVEGQQVASDAEGFFEKYHLESPGVGIFTARITSHPEVGRKWYPAITEKILKGQAEFGAAP